MVQATMQIISKILILFCTIIASSFSLRPTIPVVQYRISSLKSNVLSKASWSPSTSINTRQRSSGVVMTYGAPTALKTSIAAITGVISGGIFAGGLHAIAGKSINKIIFQFQFDHHGLTCFSQQGVAEIDETSSYVLVVLVAVLRTHVGSYCSLCVCVCACYVRAMLKYCIFFV
jgi:hypothetical protein